MDHIEMQLLESTHGASTLQINIYGQSLIDLVRKVEQPFADLEGRPHAAGEYDWMVCVACDLFDATAQEVMVLGCTCGMADCWPLLCKVDRFLGQVRWTGFYNPYRTVESVAKLDDPAHRRIVPWDYKELGFAFDRSQYDAAFAELLSALNAERQRLDAEQADRWARIQAQQKGFA